MKVSGRSVSRGQSGSATVEQTGLILLVALLFAAVVGVTMLGGSHPPGKGLGERLANRIACGPLAPGACRTHPTVTAYGWPVARLLRYFAPGPMARPGPEGQPIVPVDFRYCRHATCAIPAGGGETRLTTSNRRVTVFTEVRGRPGHDLELVYWLYRPGIGWEDLHQHPTQADVAASSSTRVLLQDNPLLVPLETLDGRNHVDFTDSETPPWQWRVKSDYRDHSRADG